MNKSMLKAVQKSLHATQLASMYVFRTWKWYLL